MNRFFGSAAGRVTTGGSRLRALRAPIIVVCSIVYFFSRHEGNISLFLQQTDAAASRVKDILADNSDDSVIGVRIGVKTRAFII